MAILSVLNFLAAAFLGYLVGRWADNYLNVWLNDPPWAPHHWIHGAILIIMGNFWFTYSLGLWIIFFGVGLFISDLKDFWNLKLFAPDGKTKETRRFWHID